MKQAISIISFLIILGIVFVFTGNFVNAPSYGDMRMVIFENGVIVEVEVVSTRETQALGLGGRAHLEENSGMLFVYDAPQVQHFWMKNMLIPIDIIWLNEGKIIGIEEAVPPPIDNQEVLDIYSSSVPVQHVLEVNSGFTSINGLTIGSQYKLDL